MSEYTPTTKQVEDGFSYEPEYEYLNPVDGGYAERNRRAFRRWLAEYDRQVEIAVIQKLADEWTRGAWANVPRKADRAADRLAAANYVGDWLRARAAEIRESAK